MDQASFYCPQCQQPRLFQSKPINRIFYLLLTLFSCGIWGLIWFLIEITHVPQWRCAFCGFSDQQKYLAQPGLRDHEAREANARRMERERRREDVAGLPADERVKEWISFNSKPLMAFGVIAGVLGLIVIIIASGRSSTQTVPNQPATAANKQPAAEAVSDPEKKYLGQVISYYQAIKSGNEDMANAIIGARAGRTSLDEISSTLSNARNAENAAWERYATAGVPSEYKSIDQDLRKTHGLYVAAYAEYLQYWNDGQISHFQRGHDRLKSAVIAADGSVKKVSKMMDDLIAKRNRALR